jgi:3-keto-5-aminohexanoate cleavage enzyme
VGYEDNIYLRKGVVAASNGELVGHAAEMIRKLGHEVANLDETAKMLGLVLRN